VDQAIGRLRSGPERPPQLDVCRPREGARVAAVAAALLTLWSVTAPAQAPPPPRPVTFNFDGSPVRPPPDGFTFARTGHGREGHWEVRAAPDAPSQPRVLVQLDTDATDDRFPVAVADAPALKDLRVSVRCKPVSGVLEQVCGLVWRYRDVNNYYVARASALAEDIRVFVVKDGQRRQIGRSSISVWSGLWHAFAVEARGEKFSVLFHGTRVLDVQDATFRDPGRAGVWTRSDSLTYFDTLTIEPLGR
jgi:hypothetical protein